MLGMMTLMPSICFARDYRDSVVMNRLWDYHLRLKEDTTGKEHNTYLVYRIVANRRNFLMWMIPTMYSIARGDKMFTGETYGKIKYESRHSFSYKQQVKYGTIPHYQRPMTAAFEMLVPDVYGEKFFKDRLLSPFYRKNGKYYRYRINYQGNTANVHFIPRVTNTQLVEGEAWVDFFTGRIDSLEYKGEFDMIKFTTKVIMDPDNPYGFIKSTNTQSEFRFIANDVISDVTFVNDCERTLPDDINEVESLKLMSELRPIPLNAINDSIYRSYHQERMVEQEEEATDSLRENKKIEKMKNFFWDNVGDHLINSTGVSTGNAYVRISPLFNPLYMSISSTKGLSYRLKVYGIYKWNGHRFLTLEPYIGYNTKLSQFYYTIPISFTYNPKRSGFVGLTWGNGNRTSNGALAETFSKRIGGDSIAMPDFRDEYYSLYNNIAIFDWLHVTTGLNYHIRKATSNWGLLQAAGLNTTYRSFAPFGAIHIMPWKEKGPVLTTNYERSILNVLGSNLRYERWEFDGVYKFNINAMRTLNLRAGWGFYTQRSTDYFVDFNNFRDNNLPTGWDDDWSGQFHLLDGRWYNESNYYVRGHVSYDSPLLALSWTPWVGRYIETERLYFSALGIERTRAYYEIGYGMKTRFFSGALFASFLNTRYNAFELKFTLEIFNRW